MAGIWPNDIYKVLYLFCCVLHGACIMTNGQHELLLGTYIAVYIERVGTVLAEQEELLREMGQQAAKPTPEVGLLRQQIEQLHSRHRTELALVQHEKLQLQQRLQAEVSCLPFSTVYDVYLCAVLCIHVCSS